MSTRAVCISFFFIICSATWAQTFSLSDFNMETQVVVPENSFIPESKTELSLAGRFVPHNRIRFNYAFSAEIDDLLDFFQPVPIYRQPGRLFFNGISLTFPETDDSNIEWNIFTGQVDNPSSGKLLKDTFKQDMTPPEFRLMPAGKPFDPQPSIEGTGSSVCGVPGNKNTAVAAYAYWNSQIGNDTSITWDVRVAQTTDSFLWNLYGGFCGEMATGTPWFRAGFTGLLSSDNGNQFYIETILTDFILSSNNFKRIDRNIHILFEPRIAIHPADLTLSFFFSPLEEDESNYIGGNILLGFGNLQKNHMRGGISLLASIDPENPGTVTPFSFSVTPFYTLGKGDIALETAAVVNPLLFDNWRTAVRLQIRVKAVY